MKTQQVNHSFGSILIPMVLAFFLVVALSNQVLTNLKLPNYGTWTGGIRDLEFKLQQLKEFEKDGPVDYIVMGSSIPDSGLSSEAFSAELARLGHPDARAFSLAIPGGPLSFTPYVYRMARAIVGHSFHVIFSGGPSFNGRQGLRREKPPVSVPVIGKEFRMLANDFFVGSPAYQVVHSPMLLRLSSWVWSFPLVAHAGAAKDLVTFGTFHNMDPAAADMMPRSSHGDGVSFALAGTLKPLREWIPRYVEGLHITVTSLLASTSDEEKGLALLGYADFLAMEELKRIVSEDGRKVIFAAHDLSTGLIPELMRYRETIEERRIWFSEFSRIFGIELINVLNEFQLRPYEAADGVHINHLGGTRLGKLMARKWAGVPIHAEEDPILPYFDFETTPDTSIAKDAKWGLAITKTIVGKNTFLDLYFMQRAYLRPGEQYFLEVFYPNNKVDHIPALVTAPGKVTVELPKLKDKKCALIVRVVRFNADKNLYYVPFGLSLEKFVWREK